MCREAQGVLWPGLVLAHSMAYNNSYMPCYDTSAWVGPDQPRDLPSQAIRGSLTGVREHAVVGPFCQEEF